jgi:hypothetical protein
MNMNTHLFQQHLRLFHEMHCVRDFRLVICVDAIECMEEQAMQTMESIVKAQREKGGFDFLHCEPLITCERRVLRTWRKDLGHVVTSLPSAL